MYQVEIEPQALQQAAKLADTDRDGVRAVFERLELLADEPRPANAFRYWPNAVRLQIGLYRAMAEIDDGDPRRGSEPSDGNPAGRISTSDMSKMFDKFRSDYSPGNQDGAKAISSSSVTPPSVQLSNSSFCFTDQPYSLPRAAAALIFRPPLKRL